MRKTQKKNTPNNLKMGKKLDACAECGILAAIVTVILGCLCCNPCASSDDDDEECCSETCCK